MYPVTFSEFLEQRDERLYQYYMSIDSLEPLPDVFFDRLSQAFTAYRISGGMPAAAMKMIEKDLSGVETTLRNILQDYSLDFVKHATPLLANRISHVWKSLPSQLAKENRKFVYQLVRPGARAREYEDALTWLKNAGLIYKVSLCSTPQVPLKSYEDLSIFKIYSLDVGLLRVLADLSPEAYLVDNPIFKEYKGALAENYILQSLVANGVNCSHYWASGNKAEVEFIVQRGLEVIPVKPQSMGNREGLRSMDLKDASGKGIRIQTQGNVSFSALRYTDEDLMNTKHTWELQPRPYVVLHLDAALRGIGNASCGPETMLKYQIPQKPMSYKLRISAL
jgi:predicted AAA+ superfamily ATPase